MRTVERAVAARINPFISEIDLQDTLEHVAYIMRGLACFPQDAAKPSRICLAVAAALDYEAVHYERP